VVDVLKVVSAVGKQGIAPDVDGKLSFYPFSWETLVVDCERISTEF
jgi:hypothetical protein